MTDRLFKLVITASGDKKLLAKQSALDDHDEKIKKIHDQQLLDGHDIKKLKDDIQEIKDDTKWTRRAITNAFIVAIIGGAIAVFYAALQL